VNYFAVKYALYYTLPRIDTIPHTLGGIVVCSGLLYCLSLINVFPKKITMLALVFIIGVLWEIFEVKNGLTHIRDVGYALDTSSDLFFDVFGAFIAYLFISKKIYGRR
jgi:hypothetical protein